MNGNTAGMNVIEAGSDANVTGVVNGNTAGMNVIEAGSDAMVLNGTLADNTVGSGFAVVMADDVTLVNVTAAYNTGDAVNAAGTVKSVNSIVMGAVKAAETQAAYSVFSETPANLSVNESNVMNASEENLFAGRDGAGHLILREDSVAMIGVWTAYNQDTGDIYYSTRPDWSDNYTAMSMQWNLLGGGTVPYASVSSYLLTNPNLYPSIGGYSSGAYYMDFGPGVNNGMVNPSYNGETALGYNSVVNSLGMGWYSQLSEQLFGPDYSMMSFSVLNGRRDLGSVPAMENGLNLTVNGSLEEEFEEFSENPYYEDGTPLSQEELDAIRTAAVTGTKPEETLNLEESVHEQVASSLRSADLFKDSFDKALDKLLGLDA